ncbi:MAG: biopolymer transporter ExbD [Candidatus Cloacimonetes bacterium]|jgi:biopolymer transport protein ExbD|nr:biopolymer transporter ExbD [Candidatus Cloacimonadota bacterium]MDD2423718.1 biopolymer transporter ExbD [Candidatus Cloacimonadota bacterium]MDD3563126.1 biopolymer transporter ExbD [Candidatus Cloacimonadota bacterium]MDD4276575.1 biopolymer transporter ExbD [Candidatus Cloacimonadota bacterium]MDY0325955.1 biopolymer transporter ExbD [Candidatus Cloacimonadaceae bacterium]
MANIQKERNREAVIPTSSMSDIAFLLLLFFMVSTVFVQEKKFWVERDRWPIAESIERIPRNHTTTVYVMRDETILIDDIATRIESSEDVFVSSTLIRKKEEDPELIVCFRTDKETKYGVMSDVMRQLQDAQTLVVAFETNKRTD